MFFCESESPKPLPYKSVSSTRQIFLDKDLSSTPQTTDVYHAQKQVYGENTRTRHLHLPECLGKGKLWSRGVIFNATVLIRQVNIWKYNEIKVGKIQV